MLTEFGKTPREWGALDPHERAFLERAHTEHRQRQQDEMDDSATGSGPSL